MQYGGRPCAGSDTGSQGVFTRTFAAVQPASIWPGGVLGAERAAQQQIPGAHPPPPPPAATRPSGDRAVSRQPSAAPSERGRLRSVAAGGARQRSRSRELDDLRSRISSEDERIQVPWPWVGRPGQQGAPAQDGEWSDAGWQQEADEQARPETAGEREVRERDVLRQYRCAGVVEQLAERVALPSEDEAGEKRVPSQAELRMYRMLRSEPFTDEDVQRQIQEDTEFLRWQPVPPCSVARTRLLLGPVGAAPCVASQLSGAVASSQQAALTDWLQMYQDNMYFSQRAELAQELAHNFEHKIRQPVNEAARSLGEPCLPEFTPAAIEEYFQKLMEPSVWIARSLHDVEEIGQELLTHGLIVQSAANPRERRLNPVALKQWIDLKGFQMKLFQLDTTKMYGANRLLAASEASPWLKPGTGRLTGQAIGGKTMGGGGANGEMAPPPNRTVGTRQRSMVRAHSGRAQRAAAAQEAATQATISTAVGAATTAAALLGGMGV
jgi:hypothetical protein